MTDTQSNLPLWPFLAADAVLVCAGGLLVFLGHRPLLWWEASLMVLCVAGAAGSFIFPFVRRNADDQALAQARLLADATRQLQKIDQVASHITGATNQWREYQEHASKTAATAADVAQSMSAEALRFTEFLQRANDSERAHLRLEVEKLRRAEAEWLQIMIHILDHVFAVFQAAHRSGQPSLADQMGQFQNSCRDAARRIGLVATMGKVGDPFDPNLHKLADNVSPNGNATIADTLATGYTFQGQIVRRPLVVLKESEPKLLLPSKNVVNSGEVYIRLAEDAPGLAKPGHRASSYAHSFTPLLSHLAGDGWRKGSEGIFTQVWTTEEDPLGETGFKIRVAAHPGIADEVLRTAVPIIVDAGCPFKVIANTVLLELAGSRSKPEEPAGDFMTVYPPSEALFNDLTGKLQLAIEAIKGPSTPVSATESDGRPALTPQNPWPGLDIFSPDESPYFFGREDEQRDVAQRLERAAVTVVTGQPGVGKSSFLRAGLKPEFNRLGFEPVYLRLQCGGAVHPVQQVRDEINRVLTERKIDGPPFGEGQTLRDYFRQQERGWVNSDRKLVAPILIFDQFEDVLTFDRTIPGARESVEAFWTQIANLVGNHRQLSLPFPGSRTEGNEFKVVFSLRQEYLPELLARRGQAPLVAQNHFVLKPLNGRKAIQAVLGPGQHLLDPANPEAPAEEIVRLVRRTGKATEPLENLQIEPGLLSFFCQQLNEARKRSLEVGLESHLTIATLTQAGSDRIFADYLRLTGKAPVAAPTTEPQTDKGSETPQVIEAVAMPQVAEAVAASQLIEPVTTPQVIEAVAAPQPTEQVAPPLIVEAVTPPQVTEQVALPQVVEPVVVPHVTEPVAMPPPIQPVELPQVTQQVPSAHATEKAAPPPVAEPVEKHSPAKEVEHVRAERWPAAEDGEIKRLKYVIFGLGVLLIVILTVLAVTRIEERQQEQTKRELDEFVSNLAAAKNTFKLAHKQITQDEVNLALKESNLLALAAQTRERERETRAVIEQNTKLAGEQTNSQSRINELNSEKSRAELRLAQWGSLLTDLTNQIANLSKRNEELEARDRAKVATNAPTAASVPKPVEFRPVLPNVTVPDDKDAAAMVTLPDKLAGGVTPDVELSATRRSLNIILTHGQCVLSEDGTSFHSLRLHEAVRQGAVIQSGKNSWCDLFIRRAGITLRLAPETEIKVAKLVLGTENGIPVIDTGLQLTFGRLFTVTRALIPGSMLEISDATGRSVIEGGGLGSYLITAPKPDSTNILSVIPLRVIRQKGTTLIAPGEEYSAKDGDVFSVDASTWEAMLVQLDELETVEDKTLAETNLMKSSTAK